MNYDWSSPKRKQALYSRPQVCLGLECLTSLPGCWKLFDYHDPILRHSLDYRWFHLGRNSYELPSSNLHIHLNLLQVLGNKVLWSLWPRHTFSVSLLVLNARVQFWSYYEVFPQRIFDILHSKLDIDRQARDSSKRKQKIQVCYLDDMWD